jgi:AcrR family transcriptional regulator
MNRRSPDEPQTQSLRERFRETTVQAVLAAAEEVFADAGLHAAHMGEIAAHAGVAVGTLYNHFADREALLAGLMDARFAEMLSEMDGALRTSAGRPFRDRLRTLLVATLAYWDRHRKFVQIVLQGETGRYQQTFPLAFEKLRAKMRELHARTEKLMLQGSKEKVLRPELADLASFFLLGMMRSLVIRALVLGIGDGLSVEVDRLLAAFLGGVGA